MSDRHFYRHAETGIVTELNDEVAAVFGDRLERVSKREAEDSPQVGDTVIESVPEQRARRSRRTTADDDSTEEE